MAKVVPKLISQLNYRRALVDEGKLVVRPEAPSRDIITEPGYLEVAACTEEFDAIHSTPGRCLQAEISAEFSLQAILYEAALEAAFGIPGFDPGGIGIDYWQTDGVLPSNTFPNVAYSVRNKPAEQVVRQWFGGQ